MGPETEAVCRTAINRRYRLLPYIYTLFREASVIGLPVMRPVFWADTRDLSLRAEQDAYMLGGDLLVVPRYAEATAALPQGDWQSVSFEDTDDGYQARLYVRDGAIVPVGKVFQNTVEYNTDELTLLVNLDDEGKAYGTLYEDAGDGFGYKSGEYGEYRIVAERIDGEVQVRFEHVAGQFDKTDRCFKVVNL